MNLQNDLHKFLEKNVKKTYEIRDSESREDWIDGRNEDFGTLLKYLKTFTDQEEI